MGNQKSSEDIERTMTFLEDVTRILVKVGGMNWITIFDRERHEINPGAVKYLRNSVTLM